MNDLKAFASLASSARADVSLSKKNEDAAKQFESWMVSYLAKTMRESLQDGPWSKGAMATFADLFDHEIGDRVAEAGGFGLQESLLRAMGTGPPIPAPHRTAQRLGPAAAASRPAAGVQPTTGTPTHSDLRVTSAFGLRSDPLTGAVRSHHGLDFGASEGTPVLAAAQGTVRFAGKRGGYGNVVILEHADGTETRYAHCRDLGVREGDVVAEGQEIGSVGSTGRSTGPHLHFEVRRDGTPIDPATWSGGPPLGKKDR